MIAKDTVRSGDRARKVAIRKAISPKTARPASRDSRLAGRNPSRRTIVKPFSTR